MKEMLVVKNMETNTMLFKVWKTKLAKKSIHLFLRRQMNKTFRNKIGSQVFAISKPRTFMEKRKTPTNFDYTLKEYI